MSHAVRTRLDEVKRTEMERLRKYARKAYELQQGLDTEHLGIQTVPDPEHIDNANPDTFEVEDLKRLIAKVSLTMSQCNNFFVIIILLLTMMQSSRPLKIWRKLTGKGVKNSNSMRCRKNLKCIRKRRI